MNNCTFLLNLFVSKKAYFVFVTGPDANLSHTMFPFVESLWSSVSIAGALSILLLGSCVHENYCNLIYSIY